MGTLSSVKDALREAVQLPLQYPGIFRRGSLQKPCKGVLLFGPPGTGKHWYLASSARCVRLLRLPPLCAGKRARRGGGRLRGSRVGAGGRGLGGARGCEEGGEEGAPG